MNDPSAHHWLIYALGGGLGHVTRATALARAALRAGVRCTLIANTELLPLVPISSELASASRDIEACEVVALEPELKGAAVAERLRELLQRQMPTAFIVDTFPRGLGGELIDILPTVRCLEVLLHRDLNPQYVAQYALNEFVDEHFDLVIVPGEAPTLAVTSKFLSTAPFIIRDAEELLTPVAARSVLLQSNADREQPIVIVIATGQRAEIAQMHDLAEQLAERCGAAACIRLVSLSEPTNAAAKSLWLKQWPLMPLLTGADLIIGAGGYNSVYEARAVSVPFLGISRKRLYDRQAKRLGTAELSTNLDALVDQIRSQPRREQAESPSFENGTHAAVRAILRASLSKCRGHALH